jgi:hypothetical protein
VSRCRTGSVRLFAVAVAVVMFAGCSQPKTAGNATWNFMTAVQVGDFQEAYAGLCAEARRRMSLDQFSDGGARRFAPPVALETVVGVDGDIRADIATEKREVVTSAMFMEGSKGTTTQRWRVDLVKEGGRWKVCSFTVVSERPRTIEPDPFGGPR